MKTTRLIGSIAIVIFSILSGSVYSQNTEIQNKFSDDSTSLSIQLLDHGSANFYCPNITCTIEPTAYFDSDTSVIFFRDFEKFLKNNAKPIGPCEKFVINVSEENDSNYIPEKLVQYGKNKPFSIDQGLTAVMYLLYQQPKGEEGILQVEGKNFFYLQQANNKIVPVSVSWDHWHKVWIIKVDYDSYFKANDDTALIFSLGSLM
jgi:hypothetical protein